MSAPVIRAGYSLTANVVVTSVLGFGFWILAARLFPTAVVGTDTVMVSAMLTLSALCQLNLTTVILRFLPGSQVAPARLVVGAYGVVAGLSVAGASGFWILAPHLSDRFAFLRAEPWAGPVFVGAVVVWGIFTLQDAILTAVRRSGWVPIENAAFGVLKMALLPVLLLAGAGHAVFLAWVVAMAVLIVPVNVFIFRSVLPGWRDPAGMPSPAGSFGRGRLIRFSLNDLGGTLFGHAATTMLPVVVVGFVGSTASAHFFIPFTIIAAFDLMFLSVAAAVTVEGAAGERLAGLLRLTVRRFGPLLLAGVLVALVAAPVGLGLFGPSYAESGTSVLRLLVCASVFRAVTALFIAVCRVEGRGMRILAAQGMTFALIMGFTALLAPQGGIEGVATAWLLANALVGLTAAPHLLRLLRGRAASDPFARGAAPCVTSA